MNFRVVKLRSSKLFSFDASGKHIVTKYHTNRGSHVQITTPMKIYIEMWLWFTTLGECICYLLWAAAQFSCAQNSRCGLRKFFPSMLLVHIVTQYHKNRGSYVQPITHWKFTSRCDFFDTQRLVNSCVIYFGPCSVFGPFPFFFFFCKI